MNTVRTSISLTILDLFINLKVEVENKAVQPVEDKKTVSTLQALRLSASVSIIE